MKIANANTSNQYVPGQEAISPGSMSNTVTFFAGARCCRFRFQNYFPCILRNSESDEYLVQPFLFASSFSSLLMSRQGVERPFEEKVRLLSPCLNPSKCSY